MKIVFFIENNYKGGLDTFIISLINNWPDKDDEFTLICNRSHPGIESYERELVGKVKFIWHNLIFLKDIRDYLLQLFSKNQIFAKLIYHFIKLFSALLYIYYIISLKKLII